MLNASHRFRTHLLERGHDIQTVQELLGHVDVKMTMIYTDVLSLGAGGEEGRHHLHESAVQRAVLMRNVGPARFDSPVSHSLRDNAGSCEIYSTCSRRTILCMRS